MFWGQNIKKHAFYRELGPGWSLLRGRKLYARSSSLLQFPSSGKVFLSVVSEFWQNIFVCRYRILEKYFYLCCFLQYSSSGKEFFCVSYSYIVYYHSMSVCCLHVWARRLLAKAVAIWVRVGSVVCVFYARFYAGTSNSLRFPCFDSVYKIH